MNLSCACARHACILYVSVHGCMPFLQHLSYKIVSCCYSTCSVFSVLPLRHRGVLKKGGWANSVRTSSYFFSYYLGRTNQRFFWEQYCCPDAISSWSGRKDRDRTKWWWGGCFYLAWSHNVIHYPGSSVITIKHHLRWPHAFNRRKLWELAADRAAHAAVHTRIVSRSSPVDGGGMCNALHTDPARWLNAVDGSSEGRWRSVSSRGWKEHVVFWIKNWTS